MGRMTNSQQQEGKAKNRVENNRITEIKRRHIKNFQGIPYLLKTK